MKELASDLAELQQELQQQTALHQPMLREFDYSQFRLPPDVTVTASQAKIYAGATREAKVLADYSKGQDLNVVDKVGGWYAVGLQQPVADLKSGWINAGEVAPVWWQASAELTSQSLADQIYAKMLEKVKP